MSGSPERAGRAPESALEDSLTRDELAQALRDEAVAFIESSWFARIAEIEGQVPAAQSLRELAEQHKMNAQISLDLLMRVHELLDTSPAGTTSLNVVALANFYTRDADTQADRAHTARREGFSDIGSWFESVGRLRTAHAERLGALKKPQD